MSTCCCTETPSIYHSPELPVEQELQRLFCKQIITKISATKGALSEIGAKGRLLMTRIAEAPVNQIKENTSKLESELGKINRLLATLEYVI